MVEPLVITQDPERDTVTIDGVVYARCVFRVLANPDPEKLYTYRRDGEVVRVYEARITEITTDPNATISIGLGDVQ